MPETSWASRPADLYGRRSRDRFFTALWGVRALLGGLGAASRWEPSRVQPVRRTNPAVVTKRELVAPDVVALTLADPGGGLLPAWSTGGHIDVQLPSGRRRQYSLCGVPGRRTDYRIAIRRIADGGGGSIEMHEAFDVGDTCEFEGPRNAFHLGLAERDVLFVIGGIGVTPILPMIRAAEQRGIDWRAIYAGRGRGPTTAVYVCGPPGMLEAVRVARNQHADAPLHYERFSPPPVVDGVPFELELARSRRVLRVPANRSALDVMLDWDPTTAYSCQQGFCGTCKVRVLAGQVDRRGRIIEGDNEMLVCVSRAVSGRVVIDA